MPKSQATIIINRSACDVFDLIHDYNRRLEWDTLLRKAELLGSASRAGIGVRSVCTGKWLVGGMAMETEYISFERGEVAAVKLVNRPAFFQSFAATLRHETIEPNQSKTTYIYNFHSKPKCLAWLLEPIMDFILLHEIKSRLKALKNFMEKEKHRT